MGHGANPPSHTAHLRWWAQKLCCEAALPVGTLHLAALYAAHGGALYRVLGAGSQGGDHGASLSPADAKEVLGAAARSLTAAQRIRECCLGTGHPLSVATAAAARRAQEALRAHKRK